MRPAMTGDYTENVLEAPASEIVCWCSKVSKQTILRAVIDGAGTLEDVSRMTGACTQGDCRRLSPRHRCCSIEIIRLLDAAIKDKEL